MATVSAIVLGLARRNALTTVAGALFAHCKLAIPASIRSRAGVASANSTLLASSHLSS